LEDQTLNALLEEIDESLCKLRKAAALLRKALEGE